MKKNFIRFCLLSILQFCNALADYNAKIILIVEPMADETFC